jgi:hypothetical protein
MTFMSKLLLFLSWTAAVQSYTEFDASCTTFNVNAYFASSSGSLGTLNILWSCLFTIIACTWTIQHLHVPQQRNGRDPGWKGDLKWQLKKTWTSLKRMVAAMLAPELVLSKAWEDLAVAHDDLKALQDLGTLDAVEWTLTRSRFANMGGCVICGNMNYELEILGKTHVEFGSNLYLWVK